MEPFEAEWYDIWDACQNSGLADWEDWIELGAIDAPSPPKEPGDSTSSEH